MTGEKGHTAYPLSLRPEHSMNLSWRVQRSAEALSNAHSGRAFRDQGQLEETLIV